MRTESLQLLNDCIAWINSLPADSHLDPVRSEGLSNLIMRLLRIGEMSSSEIALKNLCWKNVKELCLKYSKSLVLFIPIPQIIKSFIGQILEPFNQIVQLPHKIVCNWILYS